MNNGTLIIALIFAALVYLYAFHPFAGRRFLASQSHAARTRRRLSRLPGGTISYEQREAYAFHTVRYEWRRYLIHADNGAELRRQLARLTGPDFRNVVVIDHGGSGELSTRTLFYSER